MTITLSGLKGDGRCPYCGRRISVLLEGDQITALTPCRHFVSAKHDPDKGTVSVEYAGHHSEQAASAATTIQ